MRVPGAPEPESPARGLVPRRGTAIQPSGASSPLALVAEGRIVPVPDADERSVDGYLRLAAHVLLEAGRFGFRTVGVLSAHEGEGKTTAALNLAASLGRARGRQGRVLLVDGDPRRRTLTRLLCGETTAEQDHAVLTATSFENVDLLTAPHPGAGPRVNAPEAWLETLEQVATGYPQVVVDGPAVLEDPDGLVVRACVEAIVLVIEVGRTTRKAVEETLGGLGRRVVGVVLNGQDGV